MFYRWILALLPILALNLHFTAPTAQAADSPKEWTFLVFLNGNNNLDSFLETNLKDMEKVGSTDKVNIVAEWASYERRTVQRMLIKKSTNPSKVTSPVIQDLGEVDMGDYKSVVDFVRWGAQNFPAKHYFLDIGDHGSGWHQKALKIKPLDISFDDISGNHITTKQLGQAMSEIKNVLGQKLDIYGSDACLMAMAEVANEMSDSVNIFVGSEEVEPGAGWPYQPFMAKWNKLSDMSPEAVGKLLTEEYVKAYQGGVYGNSEVTFSEFDLSKMDVLNSSIQALGKNLKSLPASDRKKVSEAASNSQYFTYQDYGDLSDFLTQLESSGISRLDTSSVNDVREAIKQFVVTNRTTSSYSKAQGLAIWTPSSSYTFDSYASKYGELKFASNTGWGDALKAVLEGSRQ